MMFDKSPQIMQLKIYVEGDNVPLKNKYVEAILKHNAKMLDPSEKFVDAGFDIFNPAQVGLYKGKVNKIDFGVKCSATLLLENSQKEYNTGYYMYPRSSISKTPMRLANSVGIIDSGYRGNLMAMVDCINSRQGALCECDYDYVLGQYDKVVQICAPSLCPILVTLVESVSELSEETSRGGGGFGSTGL